MNEKTMEEKLDKVFDFENDAACLSDDIDEYMWGVEVDLDDPASIKEMDLCEKALNAAEVLLNYTIALRVHVERTYG